MYVVETRKLRVRLDRFLRQHAMAESLWNGLLLPSHGTECLYLEAYTEKTTTKGQYDSEMVLIDRPTK